MDAAAMRRTLGRMAHEILEANEGGQELVVVGILNGGVPIARRLAFLMTQVEGFTIPCGSVDIAGYRDDRPANGDDRTDIPFSLKDKTLILVDEVVFSGRTVRAAMDAILHHGRPKCIQLATLIDRGHRELPIQPDYCGVTFHTEASDHIRVTTKEQGDADDCVVLIEAEERE